MNEEVMNEEMMMEKVNEKEVNVLMPEVESKGKEAENTVSIGTVRVAGVGKHGLLDIMKKINCEDEDTNMYEVIAIDVGSTGIRTAILKESIDDPDDLEEMEVEKDKVIQLVLDSVYSHVTEDLSVIPVRKRDKIYDKLEMEISEMSSKNDIGTMHIVKGSMMDWISGPVTRLAASMSKLDQEQTYVNVLSSIALTLLNKELNTGVKTNIGTKIVLTISMPSDDLTLTGKTAAFKKKLAGGYKFVFPRLDDYTIRFEIEEDDIVLCSESQACISYLYRFEPEQITNSRKIAFINVGGRSLGGIIGVNGNPLVAKQYVSSTGGSTLYRAIGKEVIKACKLQSISEESAEMILRTGEFLFEGKVNNYIDIVSKAKKNFAKSIIKDYLQLLDENHMTAEEIGLLAVNGRVFNPIESDMTEPNTVLGYLQEEMRLSVPSTKIIKTAEEYPIPLGLLEYRFNEA